MYYIIDTLTGEEIKTVNSLETAFDIIKGTSLIVR